MDQIYTNAPIDQIRVQRQAVSDALGSSLLDIQKKTWAAKAAKIGMFITAIIGVPMILHCDIDLLLSGGTDYLPMIGFAIVILVIPYLWTIKEEAGDQINALHDRRVELVAEYFILSQILNQRLNRPSPSIRGLCKIHDVNPFKTRRYLENLI